MKRISFVSTVVVAGAMLLSTVPANAADPGVTAKEIKLGITSPKTGTVALSY